MVARHSTGGYNTRLRLIQLLDAEQNQVFIVDSRNLHRYLKSVPSTAIFSTMHYLLPKLYSSPKLTGDTSPSTHIGKNNSHYHEIQWPIAIPQFHLSLLSLPTHLSIPHTRSFTEISSLHLGFSFRIMLATLFLLGPLFASMALAGEARPVFKAAN